MKLGLNHPMGPFELVDLVGLDTRLSILEYLHRSMGEKYRPCPLLVQYVKAGRLGRKVGRGVYGPDGETGGCPLFLWPTGIFAWMWRSRSRR